jgi:hypothetical protein
LLDILSLSVGRIADAIHLCPRPELTTRRLTAN